MLYKYHLNIDLFTFNIYCIMKVIVHNITVTHYQNKTLYKFIGTSESFK